MTQMRHTSGQAFILCAAGAVACTTLQALYKAYRALSELGPWAVASRAPEPVGLYRWGEAQMALDMETKMGPRTSLETLERIDEWVDASYPTVEAEGD